LDGDAGDHPDYTSLPAHVREVRDWFSHYAADGGGFAEPRRAEILRRAHDEGNPFAPFLIYLVMADYVLRPLDYSGSPLERLRRRVLRWPQPREPDWELLMDLEDQFLVAAAGPHG